MQFAMEYVYRSALFILCISLCSSDSGKSRQSGHLNCRKNEYYNKQLKKCVVCSVCRINDIIREPCGPYWDTKCGPFIEFDKFQQSPVINLLPGSKNGTGGVLLTSNIGATRSTNVPIEIVRDGRWYTLAMALVGVLSFVALFVLIYIMLYCFVCKKRRDEKQLIYDPEIQSSSPRYTDMQPSRERLLVVSATNSAAIPLTELGEPEPENSGQNVSSSDYVYIKARAEV